MNRRAIAAITAAIFLMLSVCAALPALALSTKTGEYDAHDAERLAAFLEQADEGGVKNGQKLSENYDPADPATWTGDADGEPYFTWTVDAPKRILAIRVYGMELVGELDVSRCESLAVLSVAEDHISRINAANCGRLSEIYANNCGMTALDLTGCTGLTYLRAQENALTEIDLSDCPLLAYADVSDNALTELDVSDNPKLYHIACANNRITELNVSYCPELIYLYAAYNQIRGIDLGGCPDLYRITLSGNPIETLDLTGVTDPEILYCLECPLRSIDLHSCGFPVKTISVEGKGRTDFAYSNATGSGSATASADEGESFLGWFTPDGTLVSEDEYLTLRWNTPEALIARFTGVVVVPGDANGDGAVDTTDALLVLRAALGITDDAEGLLISCDMDGSGAIDTTDALIILRMALHII